MEHADVRGHSRFPGRAGIIACVCAWLCLPLAQPAQAGQQHRIQVEVNGTRHTLTGKAFEKIFGVRYQRVLLVDPALLRLATEEKISKGRRWFHGHAAAEGANDAAWTPPKNLRRLE